MDPNIIYVAGGIICTAITTAGACVIMYIKAHPSKEKIAEDAVSAASLDGLFDNINKK